MDFIPTLKKWTGLAIEAEPKDLSEDGLFYTLKRIPVEQLEANCSRVCRQIRFMARDIVDSTHHYSAITSMLLLSDTEFSGTGWSAEDYLKHSIERYKRFRNLKKRQNSAKLIAKATSVIVALILAIISVLMFDFILFKLASMVASIEVGYLLYNKVLLKIIE